MKTYNVTIKGKQEHISGLEFKNHTESQVDAIIDKYHDAEYPKPQNDGNYWELNGDRNIKIEEVSETFDVCFNDDDDTNCKGFRESLGYCRSYIDRHNGTDHSFFADYKGGTVSIISNSTGKIVYETEVK